MFPSRSRGDLPNDAPVDQQQQSFQQHQQSFQQHQQRNQQQQQQTYQNPKKIDAEVSSSPAAFVNDGSDDSILNFVKLSLSDNSQPAEYSMPNQSRLSAAAATAPSYLPQSVLNFRTGGSFTDQVVFDRGMPYYTPVTPPAYIADPGMPYAPSFSNLNMASPFPCYNMQAPLRAFAPGIGFQIPNKANVSAGQRRPYNTGVSASNYRSEQKRITANMEDDILMNPYMYMNDPEYSRPLSSFLQLIDRNSKEDSDSKEDKDDFIDKFVRSITMFDESLISAACDSRGTHVIQTLIKVAKKRPVIACVPLILAGEIRYLMTNQSGMHVVKQCFVQLDEKKSMPLFAKLIENNNWLSIAKDKNGCRGLNDCLDYMVDGFKTFFLQRITSCAKDLSMDIYGSYIVQHVIDLKTEHTKTVIDNILPVLGVLVTIKSGSHLAEKCLETEFCSKLVEHLLKGGANKIVRYAVDECANYVIQKALHCTVKKDYVLFEKLVKTLSKERTKLTVNKHGKHVIKKMDELEKFYQHYKSCCLSESNL